MYINFLSHFLSFLCKSVVILQGETVTSAELHGIMTSLKEKIESRITDKFFGYKVNSSLKYLTLKQQQKFIESAIDVYNRALDYISKYYDYEESPFKILSSLNIKKDDLNFQAVVNAANLLNLKLNNDLIYDEILAINKVRQNIEILDLTVEEIWVNIFKSTDGITQMRILVSKALSIPVSNAFIERVFSLMNGVWRDDRNKMRVELVRAELCVRINYDLNCEQFLNYLKAPEQKSLIEFAQTQQKYNFKI
jgi:hypothetical protein